jgi:hypothetical protein
LDLEKTAGYAITLNNIGFDYYEKGEYCKSVEWFQKAVTIQEKIGVPSNRENLNDAQENCNASKPIDWIIKKNRWGTKDNAAVQEMKEDN